MMEGTLVILQKDEQKKGIKEWIAKATRIIDRVPEAKNRFGTISERIVALVPTNETGKSGRLYFGTTVKVTFHI